MSNEKAPDVGERQRLVFTLLNQRSAPIALEDHLMPRTLQSLMPEALGVEAASSTGRRRKLRLSSGERRREVSPDATLKEVAELFEGEEEIVCPLGVKAKGGRA